MFLVLAGILVTRVRTLRLSSPLILLDFIMNLSLTDIFGALEIWHDLILIFRPKSKLHALWNHPVSHKTKVASDRNLTHTVFTVLSRSIPDAARPVHDAIYGAVDVYLKEHPTLTEVERKKVCELIDVKKLSADASIHAAQNDRLLLRMVVQILFWVVGMGQRHGETRTSGSSQSKFSSSSSRKQRLGERLRSTLGNAKRFQACLFLKILNLALVLLRTTCFVLRLPCLAKLRLSPPPNYPPLVFRTVQSDSRHWELLVFHRSCLTFGYVSVRLLR
uniref:Putative NPH3 domain, BTB/POZ domain-containing protein NPY1 n=1 Tax=Helianthus annuus TaxID=4232 RepID=A0A251UTL9_HELAN